jgi:hypothetical protein
LGWAGGIDWPRYRNFEATFLDFAAASVALPDVSDEKKSAREVGGRCRFIYLIRQRSSEGYN